MKNLNIILSLIAIISISGCKKKLLDKEPLGEITDASFYKNDNDLIMAVNAAYDPLNWESSQNTQVVFFNFFFGDIASDDAVFGGDGSEPRIAPFGTFENLNSRNESLREVWRKYYIGIYRCNVVITKAPESQGSDGIKSRVAAEAKFLRAYYHFKLVQIFGDVPLITKLLSESEYQQSKSPKAVVFDQIEKDLTEAAAVLPVTFGGNDKGRASQGSANGLLARVHLFQSDWSQVRDAAAKVINSGTYKLEPNFVKIFDPTNKNGVESVFEVQTSQDGKVNEERLNEGSFMNKYINPRNQSGFGANAPSDSLFSAFDNESKRWKKTDPRLKGTLLKEGDTLISNPDAEKPQAYTVISLDKITAYKYFTRKYAVEPKLIPSFPQTNGPSNYIVLRYADVLLMAAEAEFNLGNEPKAIEYVNQVRSRVGMPALTAAEYTGANLRDAIWRERRIELAMEGLRFFDLVRQGRAAEFIGATPEGKAFKKGVNEVFPIPQSEIDLSGGKIQQNVGY